MRKEVCPQCGEEADRLTEGYCDACNRENYNALLLHEESYKRWNKLSDQERYREIMEAIRRA